MSPREQKWQRILCASRTTAEVQCLSCGTVHCVDRDEDGASIEQEPCHGDDACTRMLCSECPAFDCAACGLRSCDCHAVMIDGEKWCRVCAAGSIDVEAPAGLEAA